MFAEACVAHVHHQNVQLDLVHESEFVDVLEAVVRQVQVVEGVGPAEGSRGKRPDVVVGEGHPLQREREGARDHFHGECRPLAVVGRHRETPQASQAGQCPRWETVQLAVVDGEFLYVFQALEEE